MHSLVIWLTESLCSHYHKSSNSIKVLFHSTCCTVTFFTLSKANVSFKPVQFWVKVLRKQIIGDRCELAKVNEFNGELSPDSRSGVCLLREHLYRCFVITAVLHWCSKGHDKQIAVQEEEASIQLEQETILITSTRPGNCSPLLLPHQVFTMFFYGKFLLTLKKNGIKLKSYMVGWLFSVKSGFFDLNTN